MPFFFPQPFFSLLFRLDFFFFFRLDNFCLSTFNFTDSFLWYLHAAIEFISVFSVIFHFQNFHFILLYAFCFFETLFFSVFQEHL